MKRIWLKWQLSKTIKELDQLILSVQKSQWECKYKIEELQSKLRALKKYHKSSES